MASFIWGMEALILGNLMMLASGVLAMAPNRAKSSVICCSLFKYSGKAEIIRPASEISLVSMAIWAGLRNDLIMGSNDCVASAGASSVLV